MPTYVYRCRSCGHNFEVAQSIIAAPLEKCPVCAGEVQRVIQPVGIVFKGSGFYKTDSRIASDAKKTAAVNGDGGKPAESAEKTPGEAKPAASTPAAPSPASGESKSPVTSAGASTASKEA